MSRYKSLFFLILLSGISPTYAGFEGILHQKFSSPQTNGTAKIFVSKNGFRQETSFTGAQGTMNMVTIMNAKNLDKLLLVDDASKSYREIDLAAMRKNAGKIPDEQFTVKPLGDLTVAGLTCKNVMISSPRTGDMEWCATKGLMDDANFVKFRASDPNNKLSESLLKALKEADADGVPIRTVNRGRRGEEISMELVKVEKKSLTASLFQAPSGYTKQEGFVGPGAPIPPDAQKQMKEAMKNMSPEQQELIKKMMQGGK